MFTSGVQDSDLSKKRLVLFVEARKPESTDKVGTLNTLKDSGRVVHVRFTISGVIPSLVALFLPVIEDRDAVVDEWPGNDILNNLSGMQQLVTVVEIQKGKLTDWSDTVDCILGLS